MKQLIRRLRHNLSSLIAPGVTDPYTLPREDVRAAMANPLARREMIEFSRQEYARNPYYKSVINKLSNHVIGPSPTIIGMGRDDVSNNTMEDLYTDWSQSNNIGKALRLLRRDAALTGLGLLIPKKHTQSPHLVKTSFKAYGADALKTPYNKGLHDRIYDGIEYDKDWEPIRFHFKNDILEDRFLRNVDDTTTYSIDEVLYWAEGYENGVMIPQPECVQAFTIYPYIRRFLQAVIEGEEFRQSFPMAVELDPKYYNINSQEKNSPPTGQFEYEPKMIPTLKPGMKLSGLPTGVSAADRERMVKMMAAAAALCIDMPANLANGDSADSNMASAQVDIQPWKNKVYIDRFDLQPIFRRTFKMWFDRGVLIERFFPSFVRRNHSNFFPHTYVFDPLFEHPDPLKNSNARAVDLASGAATLNALYAQLGKNAKREISREADLLGISYEEMAQIILTNRSTLALKVLGDDEEETSSPDPQRQAR